MPIDANVSHIKELLQWGRDVSIPEMTCHSGARCSTHRLQWGRDVSIPEIRAKAEKDGQEAMLQWGRDVSIPEMVPLLSRGVLFAQLQWGRDVSIPEIWPWVRRQRKCHRASMGPGCFHPRNNVSLLTDITDSLASMGPGCFHPRNEGTDEECEAIFGLQWGRDVSIPEMCLTPTPKCKTPGFNGAGMFPSQK